MDSTAACSRSVSRARARFLTRIDECIADAQGQEDCPAEAEGVALLPGETKKLKLKLLGSGRQAVKRLLKNHKRNIKGGGWEAVRRDLALAPQSESEADGLGCGPGVLHSRGARRLAGLSTRFRHKDPAEEITR